MCGIYNLSIVYLNSRNVAFADRFIPYFLCSFGTHIFNLSNRKNMFYYEQGRIPDMRLHIMFVAPPGWSKSFILKHLLHNDYGLLSKTRIPTVFQGSCTEAAWTGSYSEKSQKVMGLADEYKNGIVGFEEFSAITKAMKQQHSLNFEPALLQSLDGGDVRKRIASGPPISYHTDVTLWVGSQQASFNLTSGLGRRFFFIWWVPIEKEMQEVKTARRAGRNVSPDKNKIGEIRTKADSIYEKLNGLKSIEFEHELYDLLEDRVHYEEQIYEKLAIGYHIMNANFDSTLTVSMTPDLKKLITESLSWRDRLISGAESDQIVALLQEVGGSMSIHELHKKMVRFGYAIGKTNQLIAQLIKEKRVTRTKETLYLKR